MPRNDPHNSSPANATPEDCFNVHLIEIEIAIEIEIDFKNPNVTAQQGRNTATIQSNWISAFAGMT